MEWEPKRLLDLDGISLQSFEIKGQFARQYLSDSQYRVYLFEGVKVTKRISNSLKDHQINDWVYGYELLTMNGWSYDGMFFMKDAVAIELQGNAAAFADTKCHLDIQEIEQVLAWYKLPKFRLSDWLNAGWLVLRRDGGYTRVIDNSGRVVELEINRKGEVCKHMELGMQHLTTQVMSPHWSHI